MPKQTADLPDSSKLDRHLVHASVRSSLHPRLSASLNLTVYRKHCEGFDFDLEFPGRDGIRVHFNGSRYRIVGGHLIGRERLVRLLGVPIEWLEGVEDFWLASRPDD